jgi:hypothetical protein
LLLQLARPLGLDVQDRQAPELLVRDGACGKQVAGLVQVGKVRQVRVLERAAAASSSSSGASGRRIRSAIV